MSRLVEVGQGFAVGARVAMVERDMVSRASLGMFDGLCWVALWRESGALRQQG